MLATMPARATASIKPPTIDSGEVSRCDRLVDDPRGDDEQRQAVREGDQHLKPVEAIGAAADRPARRRRRKANHASRARRRR